MMVTEMKQLGNIPEGFVEAIDLKYSDMKQCFMRFNIFERPIDPTAPDQVKMYKAHQDFQFMIL